MWQNTQRTWLSAIIWYMSFFGAFSEHGEAHSKYAQKKRHSSITQVLLGWEQGLIWTLLAQKNDVPNRAEVGEKQNFHFKG